ncbi:MAG: phytanoyl-CoA dioxygenase family protein [bacterium]|nr:phytanoyl-CoA dioxygenase family protein [bacterium]
MNPEASYEAKIEKMQFMTPEEKFIFDLDGYIVIKDVLTPDEVSELNAITDEKQGLAKDQDGYKNIGKPSTWGAPFQTLIDHPKIVPYLIELLGPKFRIDHDYAIFMTKGAKRGRLHGGDNGYEGDHWYKYKDGVMRNGLTVLTYFTAPAKKGDGGFSCIPGTHKTNFLSSIPQEVRSFEREAHYVVQPEVEAGDALIFTEALVHGTMPWTADHQRRAFLYKYSPGHSSWSQNYYDLDQYENLTEQQKRIMAPPSVGRRSDSVALETLMA